MKKDEFSDILNSHGFKPASESGPSTINSLRKQADVEDDPVKAKVSKTKTMFGQSWMISENYINHDEGFFTNETMRIFWDNVGGYISVCYICDIGHVILLNMRLQVRWGGGRVGPLSGKN